MSASPAPPPRSGSSLSCVVTALVALRLVHTLAACALLGAIVFNYFVIRPALRFIPAAPAAVIAQRVGIGFTYLGWISLGVLGVSGVLRLALDGRLQTLLAATFEESGPGWPVLLMIGAWLVVVGSSAVMTFAIQPLLLRKLTAQSNPDLSDVDRRRSAQRTAAAWLDRLQLVNLAFALTAAFGGIAAGFGGHLF